MTPDDDKPAPPVAEARTPSVRRSVALSFAARGTTSVVTLASSMVLARLLTPAETGIYAVGLAVIMLLEVLREFGVGSYLIQERDLDRQKIRAAFTITLLIAWSAGALLAVAAGPLADLYGEPAVAAVLRVLCIGFILLPFGTPTMGLLRREMRFGALYRITVGASIATAVTAVTLAWQDFGPVSLAWGGVAGSATTTVLALLSRPSDALLVPTRRGLRPVLRFGGQTAGASVIVQIAQSATPLIIGRMLGFADAGLYSRANNLATTINANVVGAIANVAQPAFANNQRGGGSVKASYVYSCMLLSAVIWPLSVFLILMAAPIFRCLFGEQWDGSILLFQMLILSHAISCLVPFSAPLLLAVGRASLVLRAEVTIQTIRVLLISIAAFVGIEAICIAEIIARTLYVAVYSKHLNRLFAIRLSDIVKSTSGSAAIAASSMLGPILTISIFGFDSTDYWLTLVVALIGSGLGSIVFTFFTAHPIRGEILRITKHIYGQRSRFTL